MFAAVAVTVAVSARRLLHGQVGADRLDLKVERTPELIASVSGVVPQGNPVALAAAVLTVTARLNVVLTHEAADVDGLDDPVAAMVADVGDRGDSVA